MTTKSASFQLSIPGLPPPEPKRLKVATRKRPLTSTRVRLIKERGEKIEQLQKRVIMLESEVALLQGQLKSAGEGSDHA